ncbi:MAG: zinc-ribbon domain-containing protein [Clostridiaceae bacterium]
MNFCSKCGESLDENAIFCPKCGAPVTKQQEQNSYSQPNYHEPSIYQPQSNYNQSHLTNEAPHIDTTGILVWAIINIFLFWPISIYSIITLGKVNKSSTQQEAEELFKKAKTSCIIATALGFLFILYALS